MRTISSALQTVLDTGGPFVLADLFTVTLLNGTVLRWTTGTQPITVSGNTFAVGPPIARDKAKWSRGLNVDQMSITIDDDGSATINGQSLVKSAWQNLFDFAKVEIDRFISDTWTNTDVGSVSWFIGYVGQITITGKQIKITVESPLAQLKATFPRTYILPSCANTFCDAVCTLQASNFTYAGTVGSGATASSFPLTLSGGNMADGTFQAGTVTFTSGANSGQVRTVKSYVGGVVTLVYPLYTVPAVGDGVNALEGCLKTRAACSAHNNLTHFRGFPYVPDPSTQYAGVAANAPGTAMGNAQPLQPRIGPRGINGRIHEF
ncbi:MAG: DUF2163 domain-containing protein [Steroidobacteraceae bacterium]